MLLNLYSALHFYYVLLSNNINLTKENTMAITITQHAQHRMTARGISEYALKTVLAFGRKLYLKGAVYYVLGRKEIEKYGEKEPILQQLEGVQVVTSAEEGIYRVLTVFKNRDFKGLKKRSKGNSLRGKHRSYYYLMG